MNGLRRNNFAQSDAAGTQKLETEIRIHSCQQKTQTSITHASSIATTHIVVGATDSAT
jgi:hypothetical protein